MATLIILTKESFRGFAFNYSQFQLAFSQAGKEAGERAKGRLKESLSQEILASSKRQIIGVQGEEKMEEGGDW